MSRRAAIRAGVAGLAMLMAAGVRPVTAATIYLGPNETHKTLSQALAAMKGGDTLIIRDGTYAGQLVNPPSGSAGNYTTVKAEHTGGVLIDGSQLGAWAGTLRLSGVGYIQVEGIKFRSNPSGQDYDVSRIDDGAHHIKILRCAFYDTPSFGNTAGVGIGPNASDILVEETWAWGYGRYKFLIYQSQRVIIRRCVSRHDYHDPAGWGRQSATYTMYDSTDVLFENNISIDSGLADRSNGILWGGIWSENNAGVNNRGTYLGNIFLNVASLATIHDPKINTGSRVISNNVIWDSEGGYYGEIQAGSPKVTITHSTFGALWGDYSRDGGQAWGTASAYGWGTDYSPSDILTRDSLIYQANSIGIADQMHSDYNNFFANGSNYKSGVWSVPDPVAGAHDSYLDPGIRYITRVEHGSPLKGTASDGGDRGANVLYQYGVAGTLWGEPGYDQLTTTPLWPFPNEALIRADMRTYSGPGPSGTRGFCADGQTLSHYIWGYLGNTVPPLGLVAAPGGGGLTLTWAKPADIALPTITGFNVYRVDGGQRTVVKTIGGNATYTATLTGLDTGGSYGFAMTTVDSQRGESGFSEIIVVGTPDLSEFEGSGGSTAAKTTPIITWAAPAAIPAGRALGATQLNATASVAGTFVYSPAAGTVLAAGTHTLTATFTPANTTLYNTATATVSLTVTGSARTTPTITWAAPAAITAGTALGATQLNATANVVGTFGYSPAAGTVLAAGTHTLTATFTPADPALYTTATATVSLTVTAVAKTTPTITWAKPAAITAGTALSATQLNAAASVAGTFAYAPAAGTVLAAGTQTLTASFTPANTTLYNTATAAVSLTVNAATVYRLTVTRPTGGVIQGAGLNCGTSASLCQVTMPASMYFGLQATPDPGFIFAGWSGDCAAGTGLGHTILLNGSKSCGATFTATASTSSTATSASSGTSSTSGTGTSSTSGTGTGTTTTGPPFTLTITRPSGGTISSAGIICGTGGSTCSVTMPGPMTLGLLATPDAGYTFSGWSGSCSGTSPGYALALQGPRTCAATFTTTSSTGSSSSGSSGSSSSGTGAGTGTATNGPPYTLTITRPSGGTVNSAGINCGTSGIACSVTMPGPMTLGLLATPGAGYVFSGWSGNCSGTNASFALALQGPRTCVATFTASSSSGSSGSSSSGSGGSSSSGTGTGTGTGTTGPPFTLTITRPSGGTIASAGIRCGMTGSSCSVTMPAAMWLGLLATPDSGFAFTGWTGDCSGASATYTIALTGPRTCGGTFAAKTKTVPTITWATPAAITYGTALGSAQLNATASVAGTFVYSPAAGTVLAVGAHTLTATFTPTNTTLYTTATATVTLTVTAASGGTTTVALLEPLTGRQVFPTDNWWNIDISQAPVDPNSAAYIAFMNGTTARGLHPDFGQPPYGIPYVAVGSGQPLVIPSFYYAGESDTGVAGAAPGYPIPEQAKTQPNYIEGGVAGGGGGSDGHMLIVDRDRWILFELYDLSWNSTANRWEGGSGAIFDLKTNARRPDGWTSADAAGLAILPGLVRYDEAYGTAEIRHAFRVTTRSTNGYVWPASHRAGSTSGALPLGARLRLKASVDISGYPAPLRRIFQAMKTYGLIVADNGSDFYITGTMDARWDNGVLNPAFGAIKGTDFEVIQLGWK